MRATTYYPDPHKGTLKGIRVEYQIFGPGYSPTAGDRSTTTEVIAITHNNTPDPLLKEKRCSPS